MPREELTSTNTERPRWPVVLSIRGEQYYDGVDPDATELMTEGTLELTEAGLRLNYQESQLTGMEGTSTTFEVRGPRVILTRTGKVNSQMVFEEGRQHTSLYETPFGELNAQNALAGDGLAVLKDDAPVFAQEHTVFRHRGKKLAQAGVLPAAGRTEQDATAGQFPDLLTDLAADGALPVGQQCAVQVAADHLHCHLTLPFPLSLFRRPGHGPRPDHSIPAHYGSVPPPFPA